MVSGQSATASGRGGREPPEAGQLASFRALDGGGGQRGGTGSIACRAAQVYGPQA